MKNTPKWLFELAQFEYKFTKETPLSEVRIQTNELAEINNIDKPYHATDIGVAKIYEQLRDDHHKNVLMAWQLYEGAYYDLHNKYQTQHEALSKYEEDNVFSAYNALAYINLTDILTDGLNAGTLQYLEKIRYDRDN